jgi:hypothetical protein
MRDERLHREEVEANAEKQRAIDQETRLERLKKRKRQRELGIEDEEEGGQQVVDVAAEEGEEAHAHTQAQAPAPVQGPSRGGKKREKKMGKGGKDAVAVGAARGLDNTGLVIPPDKKGYVEGKHHEGHVHLFGNVVEHIGECVSVCVCVCVCI